MDEDLYDWAVGIVMAKNADGAVAQYLHGKKQVIGYLIGLTLREMEQQGNAEIARKVLLQHLEIWEKYYEGHGPEPFSTSNT